MVMVQQNVGPLAEAQVKYIWQCQVGVGKWQDYEDRESNELEAAWRAQSSASITMEHWPAHTFYLGERLQQVNNETGTSRCMRRSLLLAQGIPGSQGAVQSQVEMPDSQGAVQSQVEMPDESHDNIGY